MSGRTVGRSRSSPSRRSRSASETWRSTKCPPYGSTMVRRPLRSGRREGCEFLSPLGGGGHFDLTHSPPDSDYVDAALDLALAFPPAGALGLPGRHGDGARLAAHARVAFRPERVAGKVV